MKHFVNKYQYGPKEVEESMGAWWLRKYRIPLAALLAMFLVFAVCAALTGNAVWLVPGLTGIFGFLMFIVRERQAVGREKENIVRTYHMSDPFMRVEIDHEIRTVVSNTRNSIPLAGVEGVIVTKHMIVLQLSHDMSLGLKKDSFERGTAEECLSFMKEQVEKNRKDRKEFSRKKRNKK
ncbi:hypothetical protein [Bilifractor sp. HCP3S3_D3]|uniref:hypothetical protein n=1 Tax=Bilifractor sp. HCP3S3_D3 TaxID=3438907 RepID=UPI003F89E7F7